MKNLIVILSCCVAGIYASAESECTAEINLDRNKIDPKNPPTEKIHQLTCCMFRKHADGKETIEDYYNLIKAGVDDNFSKTHKIDETLRNQLNEKIENCKKIAVDACGFARCLDVLTPPFKTYALLTALANAN